MAFAPRGIRSFVTAMPIWLKEKPLVLLLFGALIVLTQGSAVAPFIYTLF